MCGICGVIHLDGAPVAKATLQAMNDTLFHRGPDDAGYHLADHIGLAMRRLSIIDVAGSPQPLYNEDQQVTVVFNGEIYNFQALRQQLTAKGHTFRTGGDGETIAHLYEDHSTDAPKHLRGQFAFAAWDAAQEKLLLACDRMGQKPIYYYYDAQTFVFASEIKALLRHPRVPRQSILDDPHNLALYLSYGYIPAPQTAFKHIHALQPGHTLLLNAATGKIGVQPYWQPPQIAPADRSAQAADWVPQIREALLEAVRLRLIADVPLGAFLSGGLDSSLIVALMQRETNHTVKTFSIGFAGEDSFDETIYARQVADYLGTDHTAFIVEPHAMDLLPKLVWHYDAPFADSSAIPTFLVSELTRQHVTVALTGDGGDELFAGYDRFYAATLVQKLGMIPRPLWQMASGLLGALPEGTGYANRLKRAGRFVRGASQPLAYAYFDWVRLFDAEQVQQLTQQRDIGGAHFAGFIGGDPDLSAILYANMTTYLPDDLLIKADRCSMAASLEARAPFMDHELVELAARVPLNLKLNGRNTKYILKEVARGLLPDAIIDRKKHGFGAPLGAWLRQDSGLVRDVLLSQQARQRGLLSMPAVEKLITEHESGQRDHGYRLWALLTLETWYHLFVDAPQPVMP
ncbi:asparagine synthase (glutamine-hydrolyzing) [Phototrophicus methaneseepsis]|uniref:asparagine synthase (glutamine-hydrolyzing) n=1 Tax=Phototrophicus methaneseepsis TaxID=2710758 RepID=A0A7S8IG45_9CHLR|nr:asparagine synthase (glutamine-hydrolyzing) [Phototrophicus methaneseepsis]QPC83593.1 asparagine synthase (glutamine-hydrolyzing) [Phototrophicus methaneseepsis]